MSEHEPSTTGAYDRDRLVKWFRTNVGANVMCQSYNVGSFDYVGMADNLIAGRLAIVPAALIPSAAQREAIRIVLDVAGAEHDWDEDAYFAVRNWLAALDALVAENGGDA